MIRVEISNRQNSLPVDQAGLRAAVKKVLRGEGIETASISLAVVDDPTIHELNRRFLQHDYATDVLSFAFERTDDSVDGEVIVSSQTAIQQAEQLGESPERELLLYVVHGTLHLVGYDDLTEPDQARMRERERHYLNLLAASPPERRK